VDKRRVGKMKSETDKVDVTRAPKLDFVERISTFLSHVAALLVEEPVQNLLTRHDHHAFVAQHVIVKLL